MSNNDCNIICSDNSEYYIQYFLLLILGAFVDKNLEDQMSYDGIIIVNITLIYCMTDVMLFIYDVCEIYDKLLTWNPIN